MLGIERPMLLGVQPSAVGRACLLILLLVPLVSASLAEMIHRDVQDMGQSALEGASAMKI